MAGKFIEIAMPGSVEFGITKGPISDSRLAINPVKVNLKFSFDYIGDIGPLRQFVEQEIDTYYTSVEAAAEVIVRNYVDPPIKGEITRGKIRWRGLRLIFVRTEGGFDEFVGVCQRGSIILQDGSRIPFNPKGPLPKYKK